jgi:polar amino acid transport system substrate-binding protein
VEVFASSVGGHDGALHDTVAATVRFGGGSVGTLAYFATGDKSFAKERVEVFGGGAVGVLDDFREVTLSRGGRRTRVRKLSQEKGFDEEVKAFLDAVRTGVSPFPAGSLAATTRATFAMEASLAGGLPVAVPAE